MKHAGVWGVALGLVTGCGGGEGGASVDTDDVVGTSDASSTGGPTTDAPSSESTGNDDTEGPPSQMCPAPDAIDTIDGLEHRGRAEGGSFIEILDLEARGPLVYGCTGTQGLTIWDVARDTGDLVAQRVGPAELSHPDFPRCQHVALDADGQRAVLTNRGDEVQPTPWLFVYDVEDPATPLALRGWSGDASIEGVVWHGDRIYAAAHTAGILVFEDTGGDALEMVGSYADADSDAWLPVVHGEHLYVAEGSHGVRVYDISADDPAPIAAVPLEGSSRDLALDGDTLFVAASSAVVALDIADPTAPAQVASTPTPGTAVALARGDDGLIYTAEWDEVRAYDPAQSLQRVWSEVVPTGDDFSRVLTVAAHPDRTRVYAGEWTGMHIFESHPGATGPDIVAAPTSVQFGRIEVGDDDDHVVLIRNEGDQTLHVYGYESSRAAVSVDDACFEVEPGAVHALELRFTPDTDTTIAGQVELLTDDPDEPEYEVRFVGNAAGADVGDPMPDFMLQDLEGNDWTRADLDGKVVLLAYFATF